MYFLYHQGLNRTVDEKGRHQAASKAKAEALELVVNNKVGINLRTRQYYVMLSFFPQVISERKVPVFIDQEGGECVLPTGGDRSGDSKDQHAPLDQPDCPWNSSCDEQRRAKSEDILLVIGGVESNPGPKNLAEKMGWEDAKCVGRAQGEGAPNEEWYFNMEHQQASDRKQQQKEADKQKMAQYKEKNEATQLAWFQNLGEKADEKISIQEEEGRRWQPDWSVPEDTENWTVRDLISYYEEEKKRKDAKKKAEEKKRQDDEQYWEGLVEKRKKKEEEKEMLSGKGQEETEDLSKEDKEEKGRKMEEPPTTPRQTENTDQHIPQVTVLIYMI